eukprot:COSAG02_NODE_2993_length_7592_cov_3.886427_2_plen_59_part_00
MLGDSACSAGFIKLKLRCRHGVSTWGYCDPLAESELEPREAAHAICPTLRAIVYPSWS